VQNARLQWELILTLTLSKRETESKKYEVYKNNLQENQMETTSALTYGKLNLWFLLRVLSLINFNLYSIYLRFPL
jgi:hypothetical protein